MHFITFTFYVRGNTSLNCFFDSKSSNVDNAIDGENDNDDGRAMHKARGNSYGTRVTTEFLSPLMVFPSIFSNSSKSTGTDSNLDRYFEESKVVVSDSDSSEADDEDNFQQLMITGWQRYYQAIDANESSHSVTPSIIPSLPSKTSENGDATGDAGIDQRSGLEEPKIRHVMSQANCNRDQAMNALISNNGDVGQAMVYLQENPVPAIGGHFLVGNIDDRHNQPSSTARNTSSLFAVSSVGALKAIGEDQVYQDLNEGVRVRFVLSNNDTKQRFPILGKDESQTQNVVYGDKGVIEKVNEKHFNSASLGFRFDVVLVEKDGNVVTVTNVQAGDLEPHVNISSLLDACIYGDHQTVGQMLRVTTADINKGDTIDGRTPLIEAADRGYNLVVKELIEYPELHVNAVDFSKQTALYLAAKNGYSGIVRLLRRDPKCQPNMAFLPHGRTPLIVAAKNGHTLVVREFVQQPGLHFEIENNEFRTALQVAEKKGFTKIANEIAAALHVKLMQKVET